MSALRFSFRLLSGLVVFCFVLNSLSTENAAAFTPVFGGPEYSSTTDLGYTVVLELGNPGLPVSNSGVAIGWARKHDGSANNDNRAVRWDHMGAMEFAHLGINLVGSTESLARDINDSGVAAGFANTISNGISYGHRAVRWDSTGTVANELGHLGTSVEGYTTSRAYSVNNLGTAVGIATRYVAGESQGDRAVRWDSSGTIATELDPLGTNSTGHTDTFAIAVNDVGAVAGWASRYVAGNHRGVAAVRWDSTTTIASELGHLGVNFEGSSAARALDLNESGIAVGVSTKFVAALDKGERAVRWDSSGDAVELDNLGTDSSGTTISRAYAINDSGVAVGVAKKYSSGVNNGDRAVRWDGIGTGVIELGNLGIGNGGITNTYAYAINNSGITVGTARKYVGGSLIGDRAVAWRKDGGAIDLNSLIDPASGWILREARGISDSGWINGVGIYNPPGSDAAYSRHFVLQIPEPASALLLAPAFGCLGLRRKRI